ncbi:MAG TPA: amidohydrolase family protein [Blastocatellia bacterium]|nr:amidohydrolase family protein [Blastocatellia bacterium]
MNNIHIYTADWVLPISRQPIHDGAVAVRDDVIVDVGDRDEITSNHEGEIAEKRDFGHCVILPGLINTHTHLELTALRGRLEGLEFRQWLLGIMQLRQALTPDDLLASARLGAIEAIKAGITTVADTCESGVVVDALNESGQRGIVFQEVFGVDPVIAEQNLKAASERIGELKKLASQNVKVGVSPHSPYTVSPNLFKLVTDYASRQNLPMAIHAAESAAETQFIFANEGVFAENYRSRGVYWEARGVSPIEYLADLGVLECSPLLIHCVQTDGRDLELVARSRSPIAHCPKSNAKFGHGIAPLQQFISAGIKVGLGSDSVVSNNVCDLIDEARTACLFARAKGQSGIEPTASDMVRMMTLGGAEALGMEASIGSLDQGKQADLCVINLEAASTIPVADPETAIVFSTCARDVTATMVGGKFLYDNEEVKTIDEPHTRKQIYDVATKI